MRLSGAIGIYSIYFSILFSNRISNLWPLFLVRVNFDLAFAIFWLFSVRVILDLAYAINRGDRYVGVSSSWDHPRLGILNNSVSLIIYCNRQFESEYLSGKVSVNLDLTYATFRGHYDLGCSNSLKHPRSRICVFHLTSIFFYFSS